MNDRQWNIKDRKMFCMLLFILQNGNFIYTNGDECTNDVLLTINVLSWR